MAKVNGSFKYAVCLCFSILLNHFFLSSYAYLHNQEELSWSKSAALEAEAAASISCSGHGRAYLDGLQVEGKPICECNSCYGGSDCSVFSSDCLADADSGNPLFLEPFWMRNAASSAVLVSGWHRMSYRFDDNSVISKELERHIRELHAVIGNAVTTGKFIIFGAGSTQLLNAAVHALSPNGSSPAGVVASTPFYPAYKTQTEFFRSLDYKWEGDTSLWKNKTDSSMNLVEFVTSPNNPDGKLKKSVLQGPSVKAIYDHAYYWPHFTAITGPVNEDLMIFTLSKLTGHAGSRFGWALIKDEGVYQRMSNYMDMNTMGVSHDTQLRTLKLLKAILKEEGRELFGFGYKTMRNRWENLTKSLSKSERFSLQKLEPRYCTYFKDVVGPSPAYAWLKCEREEDQNCTTVLRTAGIIGRQGSIFNAERRYVRLSLIRSQDDFDLLLQRINAMVS